MCLLLRLSISALSDVRIRERIAVEHRLDVRGSGLKKGLVNFSAHVSPLRRLDGAIGRVYRSLRCFIIP